MCGMCGEQIHVGCVDEEPNLFLCYVANVFMFSVLAVRSLLQNRQATFYVVEKKIWIDCL